MNGYSAMDGRGSGGTTWAEQSPREWKRHMKEEWRARRQAWRAGRGMECGSRYEAGRGWHPLNIAAMVIAFVVFFPAGFAILAWNIYSARQDRSAAGPVGGAAFGGARFDPDLARHSGNSVFEDYKRETLARLEEERRKLVAEQQAFASFLDDLKKAKDRDEFERFMRDRDRRAGGDET
jgi:hypothetical protein